MKPTKIKLTKKSEEALKEDMKKHGSSYGFVGVICVPNLKKEESENI